MQNYQNDELDGLTLFLTLFLFSNGMWILNQVFNGEL